MQRHDVDSAAPGWPARRAAEIGATEEIRVVTTRDDGSERAPVTIWVVSAGERVFVRSTNGRGAGWFRAALRTGRGALLVGGDRLPVTFAEADPADLPAVDAAYRRSYGRYASIVDHLVGPGPRAATLRVDPA